jgi:lipid II:glycine glycyltransferase (peptidoglycan interpeptide bridge formation enzyme)
MPTIVDLMDYIIALKQEVAKRDQAISELQKQLETNNKDKDKI